MQRTSYPSDRQRAETAFRRALRRCDGPMRPSPRGRYAPARAALPDVCVSPPPELACRVCDDRALLLRRADALLRRSFYQPETRRKYVACLTRFVDWLYVSPTRAQSRHTVRFLLDLRDAGASAATRSLYLCALRTILDNGFGMSVTAGVLHEPSRRAPARGMCPDELERLLRFCGQRERLLVFLLTGTDVSLDELRRIRVRDISRRRRTVTVWPGYGRRERTVALPPAVWAELRPLLPDNADAYLFPARRGAYAPVSLRCLRARLHAAARRAGFGMPVNPRVLRNSPLPRPTVRVPCKSATALIPTCGRHPSEKRGEPVTVELLYPRRRGKTVTYPIAFTLNAEAPVALRLPGARAVLGAHGLTGVTIPPLSSWRDLLLWLPRDSRERLAEQLTATRLRDAVRVRVAGDHRLRRRVLGRLRSHRRRAYG